MFAVSHQHRYPTITVCTRRGRCVLLVRTGCRIGVNAAPGDGGCQVGTTLFPYAVGDSRTSRLAVVCYGFCGLYGSDRGNCRVIGFFGSFWKFRGLVGYCALLKHAESAVGIHPRRFLYQLSFFPRRWYKTTNHPLAHLCFHLWGQ